MKDWHKTALDLKRANPTMTAKKIGSLLGKSPDAVQKTIVRVRESVG